MEESIVAHERERANKRERERDAGMRCWERKEVRRVGSRHPVQMKRKTLGQCRWDGMVKWAGLSLFACGIVFLFFK
jgi:hypothetical protein